MTSFDAANAAGTTYDGATPLLTAATPVTPGAHTLYLSIFDRGDAIPDSAVMVDNLRFGKVADPATGCVPGARVVEYDFEGFFSPVEMDGMTNKAKAGQTVPLKWRLTDAAGVPVSDPAEIGSVRSYGVPCSTLAGDPVDAVEEYATGGSGLQYPDDGTRQINWQTPASYANTCRAAFVEYGSGEVSPPAFFSFKK
ncbi:PxKF domain-containing protein [Nocardioides sp. B-3]|nr:PxKF domain-containing protein [Nocardioides sp. B-3]